MYEILELHLINQIYLCKITFCATQRSQLRHFFLRKDVAVIEWPAQSSDMNPIENFRKLVNERAKEKNPRNVEKLWTDLKRGWRKYTLMNARH